MEALEYNDRGRSWPDVLTLVMEWGEDRVRSKSALTKYYNIEPDLDRAFASWTVDFVGSLVDLNPPYHAKGTRPTMYASQIPIWEPVKQALGQRLRELKWVDEQDVDLHAISAVAILKQFRRDEKAFTSRMKRAIPAYDEQFTTWAISLARQLGVFDTPTLAGVDRSRHAIALPPSLVQRLNEGSTAELETRQFGWPATVQTLFLSVSWGTIRLAFLAAPVVFCYILAETAVTSAERWWHGSFAL
ncbi:hypothetical protein M407DRAFT_242773 [Tulasnella calospora MUT 4182]|uniref:Uncharacterized protein n=1 Tax=Tulasnella calospora MUT 4182 TaxID=1051891 RepID=A0A0C3QMJ1_9AGAM|nr:hypothetical protein M407DRAFT_242773 [Tulasnella calospora MUT 4182]